MNRTEEVQLMLGLNKRWQGAVPEFLLRREKKLITITKKKSKK